VSESPPTDRSRPGKGGNGETTTAAVKPSIALTAEFLAWHAQLYFDQGAEYAFTQVLGMNEEIRESFQEVWKSPTYALLEAQREITHEPCRLLSWRSDPDDPFSCRCSRCIHAAAWRKRGGPYLGVRHG
jgi:hypothetical protein